MHAPHAPSTLSCASWLIMTTTLPETRIPWIRTLHPLRHNQRAHVLGHSIQGPAATSPIQPSDSIPRVESLTPKPLVHPSIIHRWNPENRRVPPNNARHNHSVPCTFQLLVDSRPSSNKPHPAIRLNPPSGVTGPKTLGPPKHNP